MRRILLAVGLCIANAGVSAQSEDPWKVSYDFEVQGRYQDAVAALQPLALSNDKNDFYWIRRAWLFYRNAKYNEAIESYKKSLELNPQSLDALAGVMLPLMAQTRWREAMSYGQTAQQIAPLNYFVNLRLMACEEALLQWQALFDHAQRLSRHYSADVDTWIYVGRAAAVLGKKAVATDAYRKVLERYPGQLEAVRYLSAPLS